MTKRLFTESTVLELGARGDGFALVGRTCVRGGHGGIWNEWVMRDDRGRVRWLAEARGEFVVYDDRWSIDRLVPGGTIELITVERGKATRVATWGDVPDAPKTYAYADCVSGDATFTTFDWSAPVPQIFCGARRTLDELGLTPRDGRRSFVPAPDVARPRNVTTWLDVGDEGKHNGDFRVAGMLARSMKVDGERWSWVEYFLESPRDGFRWLSESDGEWFFVTPLDAWLAKPDPKKQVSAGTARVDWAAGELPWQVEIGETTEVTEWTSGSDTLSREATPDEIGWSLVKPIPPSAVAKAFGKRSLPKPKR